MTDKEKQAYVEGYSAKWDIKMGYKKEVVNPYKYDENPELNTAWQEGFMSIDE